MNTLATILGISPRTVEKHIQVILVGLQVENRATAIRRAMELTAQPPAEFPSQG